MVFSNARDTKFLFNSLTGLKKLHVMSSHFSFSPHELLENCSSLTDLSFALFGPLQDSEIGGNQQFSLFKEDSRCPRLKKLRLMTFRQKVYFPAKVFEDLESLDVGDLDVLPEINSIAKNMMEIESGDGEHVFMSNLKEFNWSQTTLTDVDEKYLSLSKFAQKFGKQLKKVHLMNLEDPKFFIDHLDNVEYLTLVECGPISKSEITKHFNCLKELQIVQ